eukprot:gene26166-34783_t
MEHTGIPHFSENSGYGNFDSIEEFDSRKYYQNGSSSPIINPQNADSIDELSLDEALSMNKVSTFQYRILLMCGLAFMADSLEVNLLSFLSTCAGAEWNLTNAQNASITASVFAGVLLGTIFWGEFSARHGRRLTFLVGCSLISVGGILSGLSPSYYVLIMLRSLVGFGVGGVYVPFDLLAEFLPPSHRGRFLIYIEFFWTIGSLMVAGLAWLLLPTYGWRMLTYVTAIPATVASLVSAFYLPESPRWLVAQGRVQEAVEIVRQAAEVNGVHMKPFTLIHCEQPVKSRFSFDAVETIFRSPISFSVSPSLVQFVAAASSSPTKESTTTNTTLSDSRVGVLSPLISTNLAGKTRNELSVGQEDDEGSRDVSGFYGAAVTTIHSQGMVTGTPLRRRKLQNEMSVDTLVNEKDSENYFDLVRTSDIRSITIPLWIVWFASGFAYYGIILFVARLYSTTNDDGEKCSFDYSSIFINATAELSGIIISASLVDSPHFGRIFTQCGGYLVGGAMVFLIGFEFPSAIIVVLAYMSRLSIMAATNGTWVSTPELFSTELRTLGHAVCNLCSKVGAFMVPFLVQDSSFSPSTVAMTLAAFNIIAALAVLLLPETLDGHKSGN